MSDLLFELGVEEIPAHAVSGICHQLQELFLSRLDRLNISHGEIECAASNRRLMVHVTRLSEKTANKEETILGPAKRIALENQRHDERISAFAEKHKEFITPAILPAFQAVAKVEASAVKLAEKEMPFIEALLSFAEQLIAEFDRASTPSVTRFVSFKTANAADNRSAYSTFSSAS